MRKTSLPLTLCCGVFVSSGVLNAKTEPPIEEEIYVWGQYQDNRFTLSRAEIQAIGAPSVLDLLKRIPGLNVSHNGGPGQPASLSSRGFTQSRIWVVLDGIPLNSPFNGTVAWQSIPVNNIEYIAFSHSGAGIRYGGQAMGGVLEIYTSEAPITAFSVGIGSQSRQQVNASLGHQWERVQASVQGSWESGDGIDATQDAPNKSTYNDDSDPYKAGSLSVQLTGSIPKGFEWRLQQSFYENQADFDNLFATAPADFNIKDRGDSTHISLSRSMLNQNQVTWQTSLQYIRYLHRTESLNAANQPKQRLEFERQEARWKHLWELFGRFNVEAGLDHIRDDILKAPGFPDPKHQRNGGYLLGKWQTSEALDSWYNRFAVEAGYRLDDDHQWGKRSNNLLAVTYFLNEDHHVLLSREQSYRAPNFNELYFPGFGNPELEPEQATKYQLRYKGQYAPWHWEATAFYNRMQDLIAGFPPENVEAAVSRGIELSLGRSFDQVSIQLAYQRQNSENLDNHQPLLLTPNQKIQWDTIWRLDDDQFRWHLGQSARWVSSQYDFNQQRLPAYALLDLFASLTQGGHRASFRVDNVFNREYVTKVGYSMPGRTWAFSYGYQF